MVPKGSFDLDPSFGSELYKIKYLDINTLNQQAFAYAEQALSYISNLNLISVNCKILEYGKIFITLQIVLDNYLNYNLEVKI